MNKKSIIIIVVVVILVITGTVIGIVLYNRYQDKLYTPDLNVPADAEEILLVEHRDLTTGTDGYDGYKESSVYYTKDGKCEAHFVSKYENDPNEIFAVYEIDNCEIDDVYQIIRDGNMASWDKYKETTSPLAGGGETVKFRTGNGDYIRVSTDSMPVDGPKYMNDVDACIRNHVKTTDAQLKDTYVKK